VTLGKAFVTNSVSLATRVRVDILRAIARQLSSDKEDYFVSAFTSRPVMHVKQKDGQKFMTYNFSDAISKFGGGLREEDLREAYRRAGRSFKISLFYTMPLVGPLLGLKRLGTHLVVQATHKGSKHWSVRVMNLAEKVLEPPKTG
jgi:hypothetical protein